MTEKGHDIPEWYIPDEEVVLANEHEREEIEENGELEEPLCPHCGEPYIKQSGELYFHGPEVRHDNGVTSPGIKCSSDETRQRRRFYQKAVLNDETERLR